ncbi:MAG: HTTM domain-containing protein, partial [Actinomycetota bacterium]
LWLTVVAGFLVSIGLVTRIAAWLTVSGVAYNLFLSQTHFHHNRAFLLILLVGVAVLPAGNVGSMDRRLHTPRWISQGGGRRLALTVLRVEIALVYLASGFSKLIDSDWWGGTVTRLRIVANLEHLQSLPDAVVDLLLDPGFHTWAAKVTILTELFIGAGLLWPKTRRIAVWVAIAFHLGIQATAAVQVFSWAALAALVVWDQRVTPAVPPLERNAYASRHEEEPPQ